MQMAGIVLVVLDMAGTTVEDAGQVPAAFSAALARHGLASNPDAIAAVRGASKRAVILSLVADRPDAAAAADDAFQTFRQELAARYRRSLRPIAGAGDAIAALRARGLRVALNTGFDRDTTDMLLRGLGWLEGVVDIVVCGDDVTDGRPAPDLILACMRRAGVHDAAQVATVGDTVLDLQAGHRAGVRYNIGVLSGAHPREALAREPHTHLIESVAGLPELLR